MSLRFFQEPPRRDCAPRSLAVRKRPEKNVGSIENSVINRYTCPLSPGLFRVLSHEVKARSIIGFVPVETYCARSQKEGHWPNSALGDYSAENRQKEFRQALITAVVTGKLEISREDGLMSDIKLFQIDGKAVNELEGHSVALERSLQTLIENHLDVFLGILFLASEYSTGKTHGGRIDTLGIDENGCPCIIEYKRASNENVINQGLFYLDWLMDHKGEFELLVLKKFGQELAGRIEWPGPRLLCIAGDFTKYDEHAVQQINRNIELLRSVRFGDDLLLLELVNAVEASSPADDEAPPGGLKLKPKYKDKTAAAQLELASPKLTDLYEALKAALVGFGSDVQVKTLKLYVAFKRIKNFATVEIRAGNDRLLVYLKINPDSVALEDGFTRDVREIGHWGTGDLEVLIRSMDDLEKAKPLLIKSYETS